MIVFTSILVISFYQRSSEIELNVDLRFKEQQKYTFTIINNSNKPLITSPFLSGFNRIVFIFPDSQTIDFYAAYVEKDILHPGESRKDTVNMVNLTQEMCKLHYSLEADPYLIQGYTCQFYWIIYDRSSPIDHRTDDGKPDNYHTIISDTIMIKI